MVKQTKAARFNRMMMVGMFFMAIVVLGCCYVFLYMSFDSTTPETPEQYIPQPGDSIILVLDSSYAE